jgi:inositol-pentakisphosphate 2-kinase
MFAEGVVQSDVKEAFTTAVVTLLLGTSVLKRISDLQRTLDPFDIEGLSKLRRGVEGQRSVNNESANRPEPDTNTGLFSEPTMDDWEGFVDKYLSSEISHPDFSNLDSSHLRHYLLAYLLSATFKDCSVIVRLNFLGIGSNTNTIEPWRVSVIDLEKKSMSRMEKWEELDRQIVQGYLENEQEKRCIDEFRL